MSQENVEIVRAGFTAWNAGEMDALRDLLHPEVIMRSPDGWPEPGPFVGPEAVMRQWEQLRETWDAHDFRATGDFIDIGDRVVVRYAWRGVGGRGPDATLELTYIGTVRKGRIYYQEFFWDHAEALETLGLSEQAMSQENGVKNLVQHLFWAFENDTDAFRDTLHPEIEWFPLEENHTPYHGVEAAMRYRDRWLDTWDEHRIDLEEVIEEGDSFVAGVHITARGKASGVEVDIRAYTHFELRDDKVVYVYDHEDRAAALEAVGLSEQDAHADP